MSRDLLTFTVLKKGKKLYNKGKYRHAAEILNKLVYAQPQNQKAKDLLADIFEQIGYQQESASVRNSFLAAALELRSGIPDLPSTKSASPDTIRAMRTEQWLDFLGIRLDSKKAEGKQFKVNMVIPDNGEKFVVELNNGTLTNIEGFQAEDADLTITINRTDLEKTMMGDVTFDDQIASGKAKLKGNRDVYEMFKSMLIHFDLGFEIMPGTGAKDLTPEKNPFEQEDIADTSGG